MEAKPHATKKPIKKSKRKSGKILETNVNKNTTFHNLWDIAKAFLRGMFIVI